LGSFFPVLLGSLNQQLMSLFVGYLRKVFVPEPDGVKGLWGDRADQVIHVRFEFCTGVGGGDGYGDDNLRRLLLAQGGDRRAHGRAGGQAVIDENNGAPSDSRRRTVAPVSPRAAIKLLELSRRHRFDGLIGDAETLNNILV